ncbi:hypothetical protein C1G86_0970 [Dehalococcoides mccartyi]|uniref:Uncharacterized protein n=1 Tax=Dehalococcoides mccartyi TaxID=61435 RepID=A0A328ER63_9CHLR|nr:hypothetical protein C1G86_0970 [Dehalococcoides mccartyi]
MLSSRPRLARTNRPPSIMVRSAAVSAAFILSISSIRRIEGSRPATRSQRPAFDVAEPTSQMAFSPPAFSMSQRKSVLARAGGPVRRMCTGFSARSEALRSSFTPSCPIISAKRESGAASFGSWRVWGGAFSADRRFFPSSLSR